MRKSPASRAEPKHPQASRRKTRPGIVMESRHDNTRRGTSRAPQQDRRSLRHSNVRDVHRPDLVRPHNLQPRKSTGKCSARAPAVPYADGGRAPRCHRSISVLTCRRPVLLPWQPKDRATYTRPRRGTPVRPVDLAHEFKIGGGHRARQVVRRAARDACGFGLFRDAQRVTTVDDRLGSAIPP